MRPELPSDFPAVLGSLDEADLPLVLAATDKPRPAAPAQPAPTTASFGDAMDLDLPVVAADLPAAKPPVPRGATRAFDIDLPARISDLPAARHDESDLADLPMVASDLPLPAASLPAVAANLPVPQAHLPVAAANLPVVAASLPAPAASLPMTAASLPVTAAGLPMTASGLPVPAEVLPTTRGFGEIDLPHVTEALPFVPDGQTATSPPRFGDVNLPHDPPQARATAASNSADFGDLELGESSKPRGGSSTPSTPPPPSAVARSDAEGGMAFGEVDFGGGEAEGAHGGAIGVASVARDPDQLPAQPSADSSSPARESISLPPVPREAGGRPEPSTRKRPLGKLVAGAILVLGVLGGGALQLTPYGAFGYLAISDAMHAKDYETATSTAMHEAETMLAADTYDAAESAIAAAVAAHGRTPRATPLTAYAAVIDALTTVRFGVDGARAPMEKRMLAELPPERTVKYLDVATAAVAAADGDLDKARRGLDAASKRDTSDPIQLDVALLRGDVELAARDSSAALLAFKRALELSNDARGHYGLARAYSLAGDAVSARKELDATLALSPLHPSALVLRSRMNGSVDEPQALQDLAKVLEGPARAKASPTELSSAYAVRARLRLERGAASDAREAFAQSVKLDPRNIEALNGQGRLLLSEGRYTEALARFDTALANDPSSPETIANDAEAKLELERLADAKQQLLDARQKFPKDLAILLLLGKVEQHLGNSDAAEADLRVAVSLADPHEPDAVLPFVALSELLSARGRLSDASAALDDAKKKLPASGALDRAFGEVAELQGEYDTAIQDFRSAIAKIPKDVATHFHLAVVLRRVRKFDEASGELDVVAGVDKDYPGLALERGLLFEESGDIEKAIELFKSALSRAPDDPDLQLRVGSAYVAINRPDDALPMLRKVLEKRPTSAEAHHYIGRALLLKGRSDLPEALRYLKRAVDLDPNRAEFHVYLAWAANEAQPAQLDLAADQVAKALALDKLNPEAYWQRGILRRMEGAIDDAIKDERQALSLRPSRYEAHATLAECYEDKNDNATAQAEWARAIAGDGRATSADGTAAHPFWRYRYGKLLAERGQAGASLPLLLSAAVTGEKMDPRPGWQGPAEFLTAEGLRKAGRSREAIEHYRRYLEIAPINSPDRADAQAALAKLAPRP